MIKHILYINPFLFIFFQIKFIHKCDFRGKYFALSDTHSPYYKIFSDVGGFLSKGWKEIQLKIESYTYILMSKFLNSCTYLLSTNILVNAVCFVHCSSRKRCKKKKVIKWVWCIYNILQWIMQKNLQFAREKKENKVLNKYHKTTVDFHSCLSSVNRHD